MSPALWTRHMVSVTTSLARIPVLAAPSLRPLPPLSILAAVLLTSALTTYPTLVKLVAVPRMPVSLHSKALNALLAAFPLLRVYAFPYPVEQ